MLYLVKPIATTVLFTSHPNQTQVDISPFGSINSTLSEISSKKLLNTNIIHRAHLQNLKDILIEDGDWSESIQSAFYKSIPIVNQISEKVDISATDDDGIFIKALNKVIVVYSDAYIIHNNQQSHETSSPTEALQYFKA